MKQPHELLPDEVWEYFSVSDLRDRCSAEVFELIRNDLRYKVLRSRLAGLFEQAYGAAGKSELSVLTPEDVLALTRAGRVPLPASDRAIQKRVLSDLALPLRPGPAAAGYKLDWWALCVKTALAAGETVPDAVRNAYGKLI